MTIYVPGVAETDPKKQNRSLQQLGTATSTNTTSIATNAADIATNTTNIATNTSAISALQTGPLTAGNVAAKTDQTTATSTSLAVTPGRQQFHPSAAKAWVEFTASTAAILASYNVTSVSRSSAGVYSVTLTTGFTSANYAVVMTAQTSSFVSLPQVLSKTATVISLQNYNVQGAALADPTSVLLVCFGTQ